MTMNQEATESKPTVVTDDNLLLLDCEPALVPARGSAQMICKVPRRTEVVSLELFGGPNHEPPPRDVKVIRVGVGPRMFPANVSGHDVGHWKECYGQIAPAESWIVISLLNEGAEPVAVGGRFETIMQLDQAPPQVVAATSVASGTAGGMVQQSQHPAIAAVQQGTPHVAALKAGVNEVAVFLTREGVRRIRDSITGGTPINAYEAADLVRRFDTAVRQP